jgi:hypothetical protein
MKNEIISNKELNLFVNSQNVDINFVNEFERLIKIAKSFKHKLPSEFVVYAQTSISGIPLDTFMYIVNMYSLGKPSFRQFGEDVCYYTISHEVSLVRISLYSADFKVNLIDKNKIIKS